MSVLKIEPTHEGERILPALEAFCERTKQPVPPLSINFDASAVTDQIAAIKRLLLEVAHDDSISAKTKQELSQFLADISQQLKRALQGHMVATKLTACAVVPGQSLPGGLRGVRVQ